MGQISIPAINKTGYSMYWSSMWDNKSNFSRFLKEDIYIRKFIPVLLEDNVYLNLKNSSFKLNKKNLNKINYKYNLQINSDFNFNNLKKYLKSLSKFPFYFSKIWIFRYQTWILIFFYIYSPIFNPSFKKNKIIDNKINDLSKYNILNDYYFSILKLNYKYKYFKKSFNKNLF